MPASGLISIVITTYNRSDALLCVLRALLLQTDDNFEVIVADDGSRRDHVDLILLSKEATRLKLLHIWHPDVGFTASKIRNRGAKASFGEYIVFLDGDCVPEVDFVANHRKLKQIGYFLNGSRVMLSGRLTQSAIQGSVDIVGKSCFFWISQRVSLQANKLSHLIRLPDGRIRRKNSFSWKGIRSCNMGVWKSDLERVDGFDECFVGWGHEDADFVLRLHNAGVRRKNGFCATEVYHLWHPESSRLSETKNALMVKERLVSRVTRASIGYSQTRDHDDAVITRLG